MFRSHGDLYPLHQCQMAQSPNEEEEEEEDEHFSLPCGH
jgi:hypothetical protein